MSVKIDPSGRRSIQVEIEVPGTPEQVWEAIATGPGVSSWFVPTEIDGRVGGAMVCHFAPGMDSDATITSWDPPHRLSADSKEFAPGAPTMATEWTVEARSGGTCVVRVVHSLFASTDDWDDQLEGTESGWPAFFRILRLYLAHFRGQGCAMFMVTGFASGSSSEAWKKLTGSLGLSDAPVGQRQHTGTGAPELTGVVEAVGGGNHPFKLLLIDQPAPGAVVLNACPMGEQVFLSSAFYLYGKSAADAAQKNEPLWAAWMKEHFGAAPESSSNVA
jgi:uncharacterized protein YndB with AHSA1/START domain